MAAKWIETISSTCGSAGQRFRTARLSWDSILRLSTLALTWLAATPRNTWSEKIKEPPQVEALRGFSSGVILRYVAPTGIDPVTFRFSVERSTN